MKKVICPKCGDEMQEEYDYEGIGTWYLCTGCGTKVDDAGEEI